MASNQEGKPIVLMQHPAKGGVRVPLGFSWPALVLGPLWALAKGLWLVCGLLLLGLIVLTVLDLYAQTRMNIALMLVVLALSGVYMYVCGKYGNAWWRWTLERRGYQATPDGQR
jgi:hypothetical protein